MCDMIFLYNLIQYLDKIRVLYYNKSSKNKEAHPMSFSDLSVVQVLSAHMMFHEKDACGGWENRPHSAIILRLEGETVYDCATGQIRSNATHPILLPKGASYMWRCLAEGHRLHIEFDTDLTAPCPLAFQVSDTERLRALIAREIEVCAARAPHWQLQARAIVYECLHLLFSAQSAEGAYLPPQKLQKLRPAVDYLHAHYAKALSNDALAARCGVSTVYFRKLFTAAMGTSPIQYLHRLRVEKAKEMLKSDYGTLSDVAVSVGYPNVFHFSKMFKAIVGVAPGAYAKGHRA
ncbi:MAG: helix-turn-helix transcriptional regulator [Ruminococcaceae bacterium]|nr:helix-turn-helix transcriptional regulator [Oscillospiraceae bacterium]